MPKMPDPGARSRAFRRKQKAAAGGNRPGREAAAALEAFAASRTGVEAFVEPRTPTHPLSVVLVAHDGEWIRKPIADQGWLKNLSRAAIPVYDAGVMGYPQRMRDYRRPD